MAPKKEDKKDAKATAPLEGPSEEELELVEKELLISYLKSKMGRCVGLVGVAEVCGHR